MKIKSPIVDTNNYLNRVFPAFDSLNNKLSPGFYLVDIFPNNFSFHSVNWKNADTEVAYQNKLNNIYKNFSINQDTVLIISNVSVKNNITTLVLHIWRDYKIVTKTIYYTTNISSVRYSSY